MPCKETRGKTRKKCISFDSIRIFLSLIFCMPLLGGDSFAYAANQPAVPAKKNEKTHGIDWNDPNAVAALRRVVSRDALSRVRNYAITHKMGFDSHALTHWVAGVYYAREEGRNEAWVIVASKPRRNFECHACYPKLSILIYAELGANRWQLIGQGYETFEGTAGWGNVPDEKEMALVHIAPRKVALAVRSGYVNMGWSEEYYGLYRVEKNRGRQIFFTTIRSSNMAADTTPITDWESTLKFTPVKGWPWYDINIRRKGRLKGRAIDYTIVYHYRNGTYRTTGKDWVVHNY